MITLKCKICGGDLTIEEGSHICECEYCGTKQTLPSVDNDVRANAFNRANHFRMQKEFDKAIATYERLLNGDDTDAEAHWGAALSRYGIEYVEDPTTHERIPTCHRLQITSILADADCKAAIENAPDAATRALYEKEAHRIADIQKGILAISANEKPYDIFICYKEADASGRRTPDSAIAQDIYYQLVQEGYRVFFSRITLEDKLGREYEPYIFAALNSARVMLVIGTKPEHFNAVWVKNEWSRYLELMRQDRSRLLIPCYKGMDAYDIPDELSMLQSQDMGRVGFIPDLVRNIKKIIVNDEPKQVTPKAPPATGSDNVSALLKRISIFLGDGDWAKADEYCERVLDMDPECAEAYLGKLMVEKKVKIQAALANCKEPFDDSNNYKKAIRFGSRELAATLEGYVNHIDERNENDRLTRIYTDAKSLMLAAKTESAFTDAANKFASIPQFKDARELAKECTEKAKICRKDMIYGVAMLQLSDKTVESYEAAIRTFQTIPGWKDADEQIVNCQRAIDEIKAKEEADRLEAQRQAEEYRAAKERAEKKRKKTKAVTALVLCACAVFAFLLIKVIIPSAKYSAAVKLINDGDLAGAYEMLIALNGYKDSTEKAADIFEQIKAEKLKNPNVGDTIFFGNYEQDNDTSNGKEDIEWLVLAKEDHKLLVISVKALDCQPYNISDTDITWENCSLREWMNSTFLNSAFSAEEQSIIQNTYTFANTNQKYSDSMNSLNYSDIMDYWAETLDKVFLLNTTEAENYFTSDEAGKCVPTEYAIANGANAQYMGDDTVYSTDWWLQTPGRDQDYATFINLYGRIKYEGGRVDSGIICVRPAMWISIE